MATLDKDLLNEWLSTMVRVFVGAGMTPADFAAAVVADVGDATDAAAVLAALDAHIADTTAAHAGSAISFPAATVGTATDVTAALTYIIGRGAGQNGVSEIADGTWTLTAGNAQYASFVPIRTLRGAMPVIHATDAPTVNDDLTTYEAGTLWLRQSTGKLYVCVTNADGAADWQILN